jgi:sugar phosphate isomerase/epimerase
MTTRAAKIKLGLIGGILSQDLKTSYWPTLARVAELGYQALEVYPQPPEGTPGDALKRLEALGLPVIGSPTSKEALERDVGAVAAAASQVGAAYVMLYWLPAHRTLDEIKRTAEFLDRSGEKLRAEGLRFCYHNHDHEFKQPIEGRSQLDWLLELTSPRHLSVELDMGWATYAGADPVSFLDRWTSRIPVVHVKDFVSTDAPPRFTSVGTGILKLRACLDAVCRAGVDWAMVEQDKPNNLTPLESVAASILNIRELGFI